MGTPLDHKNQVNRTRDPEDPSAFSVKPMLDEHQQLHDRKRGEGLRDDNEPSKGATEYGQTKPKVLERGNKQPNNPPDSWQRQELPEGVKDKQHGVQNPPEEDQKGAQKKQPGQQY